MSSDDFSEYENNLNDVVKFTLCQICAPALYMTNGQILNWTLVTNDYFSQYIVSFVENTDEIRELGYSNWLDFNENSHQKLNKTGVFIFKFGMIYYCDTDGKEEIVFPSAEMLEAHREKIASESALYPDK